MAKSTTVVRGLGEVIREFPRPERGREGDPGRFGPGSLAWRINAETALLLGGGRALLMQIAHPLVAAGVADYSDFTSEPFDRLWRTIDTALTVIFGDSEQWRAAVRRVGGIHAHVRGEREGISYSALDPELLLWVHATLVDSSLVAYERFVHPLRPNVRERHYLEMRRMGTAFGVPEDLHPPTYAEFRAYMDRTIAQLEIGEEGRRVARVVLSQPGPARGVPGRTAVRVSKREPAPASDPLGARVALEPEDGACRRRDGGDGSPHGAVAARPGPALAPRTTGRAPDERDRFSNLAPRAPAWSFASSG